MIILQDLFTGYNMGGKEGNGGRIGKCEMDMENDGICEVMGS